MLSPVSIEFASLFHSKKTISDHINAAVLKLHQDILHQSRLSLMTISQAPGVFANTTDYRLYDSLSNSFFDCSVRDEIDPTGAVTNRYVNAVKVSHNGYSCVREFDYNNCLSILPLLEVFEERVVKSYYEKHKDYLPMIEAVTIPEKNFFVSTLKQIISGATVNEYFKEQIQEAQRKYDANERLINPGAGSLRTFLEYDYHRVNDVTVESDMLYKMFTGFYGYSFEIFGKKDRTELEGHLIDINRSTPDGRIFITEQEHQEYMNPSSVNTEHYSYILSKVNAKITEMCSDYTEEQLTKLRNKIYHSLNGYANKVFRYLTYTQADKFLPTKEVILERLARNNIFKDYNSEGNVQTPKTIHNAFYESGLYHYLMS